MQTGIRPVILAQAREWPRQGARNKQSSERDSRALQGAATGPDLCRNPVNPGRFSRKDGDPVLRAGMPANRHSGDVQENPVGG